MEKITFKSKSKTNNKICSKININNLQLLIFFLIIINIPLFKLNENKGIYNKYIIEKNKYIDNCNKDDIYKYEYNNICYNSCPKETHISKINKYLCERNNLENINKKMNIKEKYNKIYKFRNLYDNIEDLMIKDIRNQIINGSLNSEINNLINADKKDIIIKKNNITYQITSSYNQNSQEYNSLSTIKLGDCEDKLKEYHHINFNEPLLIFKIDYYKEGSYAPIVEYEVYNSQTKEKLELSSICSDINIDIELPISINENDLVKYDYLSKYYTDACYTYTTQQGTDITLKDRKNEFINNNMSLCQINCTFGGYNSTSKKVICECQVKSELSLISEISSFKDKLLDLFPIIKQKTNIFKCTDLFFSKEGFQNNIGSYINLGIMILNIILTIIIILKGNNIIQNEINKILKINNDVNNKNTTYNDNNNNNNYNNYNNYNNQNENNDKDNNDNYNKNNNMDNNQNKDENNNDNDIGNGNNTKENNNKNKNNNYNNFIIKLTKRMKGDKGKISQKGIEIKNKNNFPPKKLKIKKNVGEEIKANGDTSLKPDSNMDLEKSKNIERRQIIDISLLNKNKNNAQNKIQINDIKFSKFNEYELNKLNYKDALLYDKRNFFFYYFSIVKRNNLFIFSFLLNNDYNPKIIKISIFTFSISLYFAMNVIFINDSTIHKLYTEKGSFKLGVQMPHIVYSIIISAIIIGILKFTFLSEKDILQIRKVKEKEYISGKSSKIKNYVKCKFIYLYIFIFLFVFFFWIYVGLFCAVFKNTQIYLIKKTLISFAFYLLYPFIFCLLPGVFRLSSLKSSNRACMYNFSKILQNI